MHDTLSPAAAHDEVARAGLLRGQVQVEPVGGQAVESGAGDPVTFPKGMRCSWKISRAVRKHYRFG
ncbi:MAG: DUF861 domain-containing protein [Deltaproteobacteria bacterium]|nr:DUF861 domain-containing protein [Deltaproteobacteria bacterium]